MRTVNYLGSKIEVDETRHGYVATDENGNIHAYGSKPEKCHDEFMPRGDEFGSECKVENWADSLRKVSSLPDWSDEPQDDWRYDVENIPEKSLIEAVIAKEVYIGHLFIDGFCGSKQGGRINSVNPETISAWKPAKLSEPPKVEWIKHDNASFPALHALDEVEVYFQSGHTLIYLCGKIAWVDDKNPVLRYRLIKKHGG